jgi:hypothetical protein
VTETETTMLEYMPGISIRNRIEDWHDAARAAAANRPPARPLFNRCVYLGTGPEDPPCRRVISANKRLCFACLQKLRAEAAAQTKD